MKDLQSLVGLLTLEKLDTNLFRGNNYRTPWKRVFGGQVLGQALGAAYQTVSEDRIAHSLHGYFILTGDIEVPIIYQVEVIRDGGSFTTRRIKAIQNGRPIFVMAASFQKKQGGFEHQDKMPKVPSPESLLTDLEIVEKLKTKIPNIYRVVHGSNQNVFEFKPAENIFNTRRENPNMNNIWMRCKGDSQVDHKMQQQILAYLSDKNLLVTAILPHRIEENATKLFIASLDHTMYFHQKFDIRKWHLFSIESPSASNSRGLGIGKIYGESGTLVSTAIQEGLIRQMRS